MIEDGMTHTESIGSGSSKVLGIVTKVIYDVIWFS